MISLLNNLALCKKSDYLELEKKIMRLADEFFPQKSTSLGKNLSKNALTSESELDLILTGHLYLERLINDILDDILNDFKSLEKSGILNSFHKKACYLKLEKIVSSDLIDDIIIFNKLRNKFAHNLNYDLVDFDVFQFSFSKDFSDKITPKRKDYKRAATRIIIRSSLLYFLFNLTKEHNILFLSDL